MLLNHLSTKICKETSNQLTQTTTLMTRLSCSDPMVSTTLDFKDRRLFTMRLHMKMGWTRLDSPNPLKSKEARLFKISRLN